MSAHLTLLLSLIVFITLMMVEVPVAFSLMAAGAVGIFLLGQPEIAVSTLGAVPYSATSKYELIVLPMFILLGSVVSNAGIAAQIFASANRLVGWMPGGLAVATIFACTVFGGISGSSAADVATLGRISVTEMRRHGYSARFAAGVIANAGTIAVLMPQSIPLVIYGILTGLPIGLLLIAGILPAVFTAMVLSLYVVVRAIWFEEGDKKPAFSLSAAKAKETNVIPIIKRPTKATEHLGLFYAGVLFTIIAGGIYSGVFTPTEAASIGALASILIASFLAVVDKKSISSLLVRSMIETANVTSMIFALLIGTAVFTYFLALSRIPVELGEWIVSLNLSPKLIVACFLLFLIPLGMLLDGLSIMLLVVPVVYPIQAKLGVDGIWLGVLIVTMIELGLILPPIGINCFVIAGLIDDLSLEDAFIGSASFIWIHGIVTLSLFLFPEITLIVPRLAALH